ncbi:hypothetical protein ACIQAC_29670 [Streptomyces sp. NPDC088387]|uniref:hypothetical protein n=1 Tax=Streptomyces sp. NPDC088387 TaxID=3365859 RepID=UPI003802941E
MSKAKEMGLSRCYEGPKNCSKVCIKSRIPEAQNFDPGKIGEQRDAVSGVGTSFAEGSKSTITQVRVGNVIMLTVSEAGSGITTSEAAMTQYAAMLAKRVEEARSGNAPSAAAH